MKHPHSFKIYSNYNTLECSKCGVRVHPSRKAALYSMYALQKVYKFNFNLHKFNKNVKLISYKHYVADARFSYNHNNIVYTVNLKHQLIKKFYCLYSDEEFLVRDILK